MAKKSSHKSKSKKPIITIDDYYCNLNRYLFALDSQLSIFQLAYNLQLIFHNTFQRIANYPFIFEETNPQYTAVSTRRIFAQASSGNSRANLILFDNKVDLDLELKSNREKNLNIQTLSLFPPDYYIFSRQGIKKFKAELDECNYLLLVICEKSFPFKDIEEPLHHAAATQSTFKIYDINKLLHAADSQKTKVKTFLGAFSIDTEKTIDNFVQQTHAQCLRDVKSWVTLNLPGLELPPCTIHDIESLRLLQYDESFE
ncbi:MAG: hypothetical protein LBL18_05765 [Bacteroidales bacterium]|nr:hypothetical protein [Bacteroidales bacterium]